MNRKLCLTIAAVFAIALAGASCQFHLNLLAPSGPLAESKISGKGADKILMIPVEGFISVVPLKKALGGGGQSVVNLVKTHIEKAKKDKRIKAIILKVDSPGGLVTACDIIYNELQTYKKQKGVKIVALLMSVAVKPCSNSRSI